MGAEDRKWAGKPQQEEAGDRRAGRKGLRSRGAGLVFLTVLAFFAGMTAFICLPPDRGRAAEEGKVVKTADTADGEGVAAVAEAAESAKGAEKDAAAATAPAISAAGAILINAEDGMVLYEYNADERLYPASTTKIMTALLILETCEALEVGLDSQVIVPAEAQGVEGSSIYLKAGEKVSLEELLYGLMLQSGNDSAVALAICLGGTQENFIDRMNERASTLGCSGTNFVNPNGLFDENHYTTARDLAVIAREAMTHEAFRKIVAAENWSSLSDSLLKQGEQKTGRYFENKNKTVFQYEGGNGIKIGYTKASGRTLVASAKRGDTQLIAVVLRDGNWFQDAYRLMDFGFEMLGEGGDD